MTAGSRADYTALLWEQREDQREAARPNPEYDDYLDRLAGLVPHPFLGRGWGCGTCGLPLSAAIHHWDDASREAAA